MEAVQEFEINTKGRDLIVGDLQHGYRRLDEEMKRVGFNSSVDRMFAAGDLATEPRCADFLKESWFHAVRGNREAMFLEYAQRRLAYGLANPTMLMGTGMGWINGADTSNSKLREIIEQVQELPFAIQIARRDEEPVGIIHADIPQGMSWPEFTDGLKCRNRLCTTFAQWGSDQSPKGSDRVRRNDETGVAGASRICAGHVTMQTLGCLGNVYYIDTQVTLRDLDKSADWVASPKLQLL